jgi:hypothetical protein
MKEKDEYYSHFEKLMRAAPGTLAPETPEHQTFSARYPYLSESIRLRKEFQRLKQELRTAKEKSTRLQIGREMENLASRLKRHDMLMRLHGESKLLRDYKIRFLIVNAKQRSSSLVLKLQLRIRQVHLSLQNRLQEQSRRARYTRTSILPPSLRDMRSLDPVDRSVSLRDWIERRKIRIQRHKPS